MLRALILCLFVYSLTLIFGCAAVPKAPLHYQAGAVVDSLSASASVSISNGQQGMSANGYLLYQRPDRMRMVILNPFNTPLTDAIINENRITIINSSEGVAFSGLSEELPDMGEGDTWRHARWVMDLDPPGESKKNGVVERLNKTGIREQVVYQNGLVVSKSLPNGDSASYDQYVVVNGVPLATEIIIYSRDGSRFRILLTEPEVNMGLAPDAFTPRLEGMRLYPLDALKKP